MMVGLMISTLLLSADVCAAATTAPTSEPARVVVEGTLVFDRHSTYIVQPGRTPGNTDCVLFTVFPGTPRFMLHGLDKYDGTQSPQVDAFVRDYKDHVDRGGKYQAVRIRGRVIARKGFVREPRSERNGFGYHNFFRCALFVDEITPSRH